MEIDHEPVPESLKKVELIPLRAIQAAKQHDVPVDPIGIGTGHRRQAVIDADLEAADAAGVAVQTVDFAVIAIACIGGFTGGIAPVLGDPIRHRFPIVIDEIVLKRRDGPTLDDHVLVHDGFDPGSPSTPKPDHPARIEAAMANPAAAKDDPPLRGQAGNALG